MMWYTVVFMIGLLLGAILVTLEYCSEDDDE